MGEPAKVVRSFFESMEARDWAAAERMLSPELRIDYTETGEHFSGGDFLAMNRAYPEGWRIEVVEVIAEGERVAAQIRVPHDGSVFWCAGFYTVEGGQITSGTEHWVTERSAVPPEWRKPFAG